MPPCGVAWPSFLCALGAAVLHATAIAIVGRYRSPRTTQRIGIERNIASIGPQLVGKRQPSTVLIRPSNCLLSNRLDKGILSGRIDEGFEKSTLVSTVVIRPAAPAWLSEYPLKAVGRTGEHIPG